MMLTKPKPDDGKETKASASPSIMNQPPAGETSADDREKDLERRLAMLGGTETETVTDTVTDNSASAEEEEEEQNNNLISFDPLALDNTTTTPTAPSVIKAKPEPVKPSVVKPNKSALLARIMAAQERARQAQMKQATEVQQQQQNPQSITSLPPPTQMKINAEQEKDKMMMALNGVVDNTMEKETKNDDYDSLLKPPSLPPPPFMAPPTTAPPTTTTMMPPPPSFEIFEQQQMKSPAPSLPPPAFHTIENEILGLSGVQAPSAPPTEESMIEGFDGITPMAPPPTYPGSGEQQVIQEESSDAFEFDIDGNPLSPEERRKMMEEQRAIMEQIQKQAHENKASEAAVRANAFETRMMGGNQTVKNTPAAPTSQLSGVATAVDIGSIDPAEVEEQRKILEEIQKQVKKTRSSTTGDYESPAAESSSNAETVTNRTVDIGDGKKVALHGQEKTKEAIKDGTAILVQCVNCDNWMQVTGAATLMFCPVCSVVSPVLKQGAVHSTEAATQMEEDRKLAERLQNEENSSASEYPGNRRQHTAASSTAKSATSEEGSWWNSLMTTMEGTMVSMGVSTASPEDSGEKRSAEIKVNRPPGGSMAASQGGLHGVVTGNEYEYEREGLLGSGGSSSRDNEARVAESKPLFSCVVDSVSNAASAAAAGVTSMAYGEDEEVNGVDTTSFLAVPKIGDDRGSSGNYNAIPNKE